MSCQSPVTRSKSRASQFSDATYHSFTDDHVHEPVLSSSPTKLSVDLSRPSIEAPSSSAHMSRQDSGYSSGYGSGQGSVCSRPSIGSRHRTCTMSTSTSSSRPRTRPSIHRASRSGPVAQVPNFSQLNTRPMSQLSTPAAHEGQTTYFYFPSPDPSPTSDLLGPRPVTSHHHSNPPPRSETPSYPLPPQTTHYWTSDRTRRLEYAAIDAASRGVKGWMMRHMVPECFVPKENRRMCFDDDTGSVRRYRLELEDGAEGEKDVVVREKLKRRGTWL